MHTEHADIDAQLRTLLERRVRLARAATIDAAGFAPRSRPRLDRHPQPGRRDRGAVRHRDPGPRHHRRQLRQRRRDHPLRRRPAGAMSGHQSVAAMLAATVDRFGSRLALVDGPRRCTWDELMDDTRQRAAALSARGVGPGDGVALVLGNNYDFVTTFLATQLLGATAVPLNPLFTDAELGQHLAQCDIRGDRRRSGDGAGHPGLGEGWIFHAAARASGSPTARSSAPVATPASLWVLVDGGGPTGPALFAFSSGSTGTPKGMVRTNANLASEAEQFNATVGVTEDDVILAVVALFHAHGLGNALLASIRSGAALVLLPRFERDAVLGAIERERVSVFPAVPFIFHTLAETRRSAHADVAALRLCISGRRTSRAGDVRAVPRPLRHTDPPALRLQRGRVGHDQPRPRSDEQLRVGRAADAGHRPRRRRRGGYGPTTGREWRDRVPQPRAHRRIRRRRRRRRTSCSTTGGSARATSATSTTPATSTSPVAPSCSSRRAASRSTRSRSRRCCAPSPGVVDVVVVGTKGDRGEEVVKAVVVPAASAADESRLRDRLVAACADTLAPFKVPRIVEFRTEIPRSPLGKILRKYLV